MKDGLSEDQKKRSGTDVFEVFSRFMNAESLLKGIQHIDLAFSGGADSVALLALLVRYQKSFDTGFTLRAHHIRHGLRAEDWRDVEMAESLAERFGVEFLCTELVLGQFTDGKNVEAVARDARYLALTEAVKRLAQTRGLAEDGMAIALGHHGDDNVETALWRLGRGCGIEGLSLAWRRKSYGLTCIRPLLRLSKAELYAYLEVESIPWIEDPSNASDAFLRNRIRHHLLEELKASASSHGALYTSLIQLRRDADAVTSLCQSFLDRQSYWQDSCFCRWDEFELLAVEAQSQILRQLARRIVVQHLTSADFIANALCMLQEKSQSHRMATDGRISFAWSRDGFLAWREGSMISVEEIDIDVPCDRLAIWGLYDMTIHVASYAEVPANDRWQLYIDADAIVLPLRIVGAGHFSTMPAEEHRIKLGEALRSQGVPAHWRKSWPILCDAQGPLWILGGARSARAIRPDCQHPALYIRLDKCLNVK